MTPNKKISIVTTLYGSAPYLKSFYERCVASAERIASSFEIILVDDGSPDASGDIAAELHQQDPRVHVIHLSRNFGHHRAMMAGLSYAVGERVFILDCDLEEDPEWLIAFDDVMDKTGAGIVIGVQTNRKGNWFERWSGAFFYALFNWLSVAHLQPNPTVARLMSRSFVEALLMHRERDVFLFGLCELVGFHQEIVQVVKHFKGTSTYNLRRRVALFIDAMTAFTDKPLIYIFWVGIVISSMSGVSVVFFLVKRFIFGVTVEGWTSIMISVWLLGGLIISFLGVIGIYLSRIYSQVKARPIVVVKSTLPASLSTRWQDIQVKEAPRS